MRAPTAAIACLLALLFGVALATCDRGASSNYCCRRGPFVPPSSNFSQH